MTKLLKPLWQFARDNNLGFSDDTHDKFKILYKGCFIDGKVAQDDLWLTCVVHQFGTELKRFSHRSLTEGVIADAHRRAAPYGVMVRYVEIGCYAMLEMNIPLSTLTSANVGEKLDDFLCCVDACRLYFTVNMRKYETRVKPEG
jgi:hypothetical protein